MTEEQIKNWFYYHATTPETSPLYAAIRAGEADVLGGLGVVDACVGGL